MSYIEPEQLYRGRINCTRCGKGRVHTITQFETKLAALCWSCVESLEKQGEKPRDHAVAHPCGIHVAWDLVEKAIIFKLREPGNDWYNRGLVIAFVMKDIENLELVQTTAVEICQFVMFFAGRHGIQQLGKEGEQNYAFVHGRFGGQPFDRRVLGTIDHKALGDDEMECMRDLVRLLAKQHGWQLEDHMVLEALAAAAPEKPKKRGRKKK